VETGWLKGSEPLQFGAGFELKPSSSGFQAVLRYSSKRAMALPVSRYDWMLIHVRVDFSLLLDQW
jgi:hypothetical protein